MAIWYAKQQGNAAGGWSAANPAAQGGLLANASGSLGLFGGSAAGTVEQPTVRYYCASVRMADGTAAANGTTVHLHHINGDKHASYPTGLTTLNHPTGHPTYATTETGWICFQNTALIADQVDLHLTILPQGSTTLESGVSILVTPQLTSNGNG